jgi:CRISPR/Cas system-associated exonuclease Cas4 (RecB family)
MYEYVQNDKAPRNKLAKAVVDLWIQEHELEPVALEDAAHVEHSELKFQGTPDYVGMVDGKACVLDWKTSAQIDKTMELQLAMYALAWNFQKREPFVDTGIVVRVDKKTLKVESKLYPDLSRLNPLLEGLIKLCYFLRPLKIK